MALPKGVILSASAANGLHGCSDAQFGLHQDVDAECPRASKIGTVKITTPVLPDPLEGAVYQGTQTSNQVFRIFIEAAGDGARVKLPGSIDVDPVTGQITSTFDNTPQLPFSDFELSFKGGQGAPLTNPAGCGTYTTTAELTPWSSPTTPVATVRSSFDISFDGNGAQCPAKRRFAPGFVAGTADPVGGRSTSFTLSVSRDDEDQELQGISVSMPRGVTGRIANVPLCPRVEAAFGTCGQDSQVGSVETGAGAGANPLFLPGKVYITGPYKGAPFGLSIVVPAIAGPFDLGTVVVRSTIFVDRHTAQLRVVSDPLPTILDGVPLQVRAVNVTIDRSKFIINPTNCDEMRVAGTITSTQGAVAHVGNRFQVGECDRLPFHPKMTLKVGGKGHTSHGSSTPFTTTLEMTPGQANLKAVGVTLPLTLNALLNVVNNACTQDAFDAGHCEEARAGSAVAVTPLLKHALRGGVYFVKDPTKPTGSLPNLVVALRGQVDFDLVGQIKIPGGTRLATHFNTIPDVPVKKFTLKLVSGPKGPLGVAEDLCTPKAQRQTAAVSFRAQNGDLIQTRKRLDVAGCHSRARR